MVASRSISLFSAVVAASIATHIALADLIAPAIAQSASQGQSSVPSLAPVLERVTPAVVNIAVTSAAQATANPLYNDPFFRRFFNLPEEAEPPADMSAGSGVIVDARRGHVLTNHHVVANAGEISVTLKDRRRFRAKLIGSDEATDIALLRIDADDLTDLELGDSDRLRVGDYVVAIGNPFGLGQTVTAGIVSALGRSGLNIEGYEDFIQTDASINPGNSGGALITLDGHLVGINSAILAPAGGNIGIGFAVPVNMARAVMQQLAEHGEVRRGQLGVAIQDLTPALAESLGLPTAAGALIAGVEPGTPAGKAGLRPGDVVLGVNQRPVAGASDLRNRIGLTPLGAQLKLEIWRDGKQYEAAVRMASRSGDQPTAARRLAGARLRDLTAAESARLGTWGVLVVYVAPNSAAEGSGVLTGDVIVAVDKRSVQTLDDLTEALAKPKGRLALSVIRDGTVLTLMMR